MKYNDSFYLKNTDKLFKQGGRLSFKATISLFVFFIFISSSVLGQICTGLPNSHIITEYGSFTADFSDASTIATNNATINGAIVTLGKAGGGILLLPAGTFYIGPNPTKSNRAITIAYNNITICGAGIGETGTILKTNGTWNVAFGRRGVGIKIEGTPYISNPRKNIVLKNFELDGQSGWTGVYNWPADAATGAGWDITHKGIIPSADTYTDSVTLENLYVHRYSGEILYCGGFGMGKLTVRNVISEDTNGSDFNLWAAELLVENCEFGGPSRFWLEIGMRPSQNSNTVNKAIFRNNSFHDAKLNGAGIVFCQGDYKSYSLIFEDNTIKNGFGVFAFYGGVGGPVSLKNNNISNCTQKILETNTFPGWVNNASNKNVIMENNTITGASHLAFFNGWAENFVIRNNNYSGTYSIVYAGDSLGSNLIEGNTFTNSRTPEEETAWKFSGKRPFFQNNTYINCEARYYQGIFNINAASPLVTPHYEQVKVNGQVANVVAQLATKAYPQGQKVAIIGGSTLMPVKFAAGQSSYFVSEDRYLNGSDTLNFTFNTTQGKWLEDLSTNIAKSPISGDEISLYPNPASTEVNISIPINSGTVNVEVINIVGQKIIGQTYNSNLINLKLNELNSGIYFVKVEQGGLNIVKKLIIKK
ncbi:MAG TPA: T9SS type A sorting domain-containing protein [Prolixibacteraceae bacterium]|jgi:hypothetical protein